MPSKQEILAQAALLSSLTEVELDELAAVARTVQMTSGQPLFRKGDEGTQFYVIVRGVIRISTISAGGRETLLNLLRAGETFGEIALLDGGPRTADAVAHEASELLMIERRELLPFLDRHPEGVRRMLAAVCERLRWVSQLYEDSTFLDLPRRLAKRLLLLAKLFGRPSSEGGTRIALQLSQQDLAALMGVTRESINRQMKLFAAQGLINLDEDFIVITDVPGLEKICFAAQNL